MKKTLAIYLVIMVMLIMPFVFAVAAMAAEPEAIIVQAAAPKAEPAAVETMAVTTTATLDPGGGELFTWAMLATHAGAVAATIIITQIFKGIGFVDKIPTRIFSYIVAFVIMILATLFTEGLTAAAVFLLIINAAVVSLAANGTVDAYNQAAGKNTNADDLSNIM